jgi:hypothetical protein
LLPPYSQCLTHSKELIPPISDLNTLPYIVYQILSGVDYNPHKLLFHQVLMHDAAAFQAILALASKHVVTGLSGTADTVQSLTHKTRTIQLVNKRLQDPATAVKDSTLYAIGALSVIEVSPLLY